jgi:hypothetical protein
MNLFWIVAASAAVIGTTCCGVSVVHALMTLWTVTDILGINIFLLIAVSALLASASAFALRWILVRLGTPAIPIVW